VSLWIFQFTDNIDYWVAHSFKFQFQNISTFWVIGGHDVNVYGGGTIDGSGQTWWTAAAANTSLSAFRPALVGYVGFYGGSVSDLTLIQPPNWFHFVANATDVVFDGLNLTARGIGPTAAQNSGMWMILNSPTDAHRLTGKRDGWDTYRSDNIVIQNSIIQNGDGDALSLLNISSAL
jgi:galacturan 1,4-alpha-galacturonidase